MADLSNFLNSGGAGFKLAPDLTFIDSAAKGSDDQLYRQVTINPSGGLTTAFSLSGKWQVNMIAISPDPIGICTVKLTTDSSTIWEGDINGRAVLLGSFFFNSSSIGSNDPSILCENSMVFEIQSASTSVTVSYRARPIL